METSILLSKKKKKDEEEEEKNENKEVNSIWFLKVFFSIFIFKNLFSRCSHFCSQNPLFQPKKQVVLFGTRVSGLSCFYFYFLPIFQLKIHHHTHTAGKEFHQHSKPKPTFITTITRKLNDKLECTTK